MSLNPFTDFKGSPRRAVVDLRQHLVDYIKNERPEPGTRLATEAELIKRLKISRSTLRRALEPLEEDGWIDRRPGSGTYIGMRVSKLPLRRLQLPGIAGEAKGTAANRNPTSVIRVAVLIYNIGDLSHDWYTPGILQGLDDASNSNQFIVELLGDHDSDPDACTRRLSLTRPQVLICLSNKIKSAYVLRDAIRLGIPCLTCGTPLIGLEIPGVSENNSDATAHAMEHLIQAGHQRIILGLPRISEPWVFDRMDEYQKKMRSIGGEPTIFWTGRDAADGDLENLLQTIETVRATAIVSAHVSVMRVLDQVVRSGRLRVPEDLSVISFEQDHSERNYLGHPNATRIVFPLRAMGRKLGELAQQLVEGQTLSKDHVVLASELIEGTTVQQISLTD